MLLPPRPPLRPLRRPQVEAITPKSYKYLLSFVGSVRFHTPGYSMGVRQRIFRTYNLTDRFFLRDLRGDSKFGVHKRLDPKEYLEVLKASKFCLAPSGMGFSTRSYESIAQGCVPLVIQDDPDSNSSVDQVRERGGHAVGGEWRVRGPGYRRC